METISSLDIPGFRADGLPNTFFRSSSSSRRLVVILPGRGYTCAMPLLYYPTRWAVHRSADVLWVEYGFNRQPAQYNSLDDARQREWLYGDAVSSFQTAIAAGNYSQTLLIGKSLGTLALAHLALHEPAAQAASFCWLTPLLKDNFLRRAVLQSRPKSLFVQGAADPAYDSARLQELQTATASVSLVIPGADHSLENGPDLQAAFANLGQVLQALSAFTGW